MIIDRYQIIVTAPAELAAIVRVYQSDNTTAAVSYTTETGNTTTTFPLTVAAGTSSTMWVPAGKYYVSAKVSGVEMAAGYGTRWSGYLEGNGQRILPDPPRGVAIPSQSVAYAASITPDPNLGETIIVGALTGNLSINAPTGDYPVGKRVTFILTQDGTGGRTMTFNATFKKVASLSTTASKINTISFVYNGTNWIENGASVGI